MRRLLCISGCLSALVVACDKPVLSEIVEPRYEEGKTREGFADGAVIRDEFDGGLDAGEGDFGDVEAEDVPFSKAAFLRAAADCAVNRLEALRSAAQQLRDDSARWAKDRTPENAATARSAFRVALSRLQRSEPLKFGPAARSSSPGGQNLGDKLYTPFPSLDLCAIDRQLALGTYSAKDVAMAPARQRGLGAFEYLAYYVASGNGCQSAIDINANGTWAGLGEEEIGQRRADFAAAIAEDVLSLSEELLTAWSPRGGNFYGEITKPGGATFRDEQSALNAIFQAAFYTEIDLKDAKLGRILNRSGTTCQSPTCPEALEAPLSGLSGQNMLDNLSGFRDLFQGCARDNRGLGYDDWLEAVGASATTTTMLDELTGAERALSDVRALEDALKSDRASVMRAYDAVKQLTDRLKGDLKSILGLEPPAGLEGDND
jgi:predicted lipoprotein